VKCIKTYLHNVLWVFKGIDTELVVGEKTKTDSWYKFPFKNASNILHIPPRKSRKNAPTSHSRFDTYPTGVVASQKLMVPKRGLTQFPLKSLSRHCERLNRSYLVLV
jgi:hypothetical protein